MNMQSILFHMQRLESVVQLKLCVCVVMEHQCVQVFNILCEQPEVAAAYLVPRARSVAARSDNQTYIRCLTGVLLKLLSMRCVCGHRLHV
jgi:hypothetical protein